MWRYETWRNITLKIQHLRDTSWIILWQQFIKIFDRSCQQPHEQTSKRYVVNHLNIDAMIFSNLHYPGHSLNLHLTYQLRFFFVSNFLNLEFNKAARILKTPLLATEVQRGRWHRMWTIFTRTSEPKLPRKEL